MPPSDASESPRPSVDDTPTSATGGPPHTIPSRDGPPAAFGTIGRYALIEEIGRGGMGTVVRAYDPKLRREVALKRLAAHALGTDGEARLIREAQAMAKLSHPNVVAVHDVEAGDEGVTLVMEYVAGETLREWLRHGSRTWKEIVEVFCQAGEGLAAAHRTGLVHRDFKPGNVLVTAEGRVKVTDFGLAKAAVSDTVRRRTEIVGAGETSLDPSASADSIAVIADEDALTRDDVVMGTPPYMAPEQHLGHAPDARADQYAFCVALWSALHRAMPFQGKLGSLLEAKRSGPPAWPKGSDVPRPVAAAIERGLRPEPDARWPSMDLLLAALAHDPAARGRRVRAMVVGIGGLAAIVGLPLLVQRTQEPPCAGASEQLRGIWDDSRRDEIVSGLVATGVAYAPETAERVQHHLDRYAEAWATQHTDACEATAVRSEQSAALLDLRMSCLQRAKLRLVATIDALSRPDEEVVDRAVALVQGLPSVEHCADVTDLQSETPPPSDPEIAAAVEAQRAEIARGRALVGVGKYKPALELAAEIDEAAVALDFGPLLAEAKQFHGSTAMKNGRYDEAHALLDEALQLALAHHAWSAVDIAHELVLVSADRLGRPEEAHAWASVAMGLARARDPGGELEASANAALAVALRAEGRYEDALACYERSLAIHERTLGSDHPQVAMTASHVAMVLKQLGRHGEAEAAALRANEMVAITYGPEHPLVAGTMNTLAGVYLEQGKMEEGERVLRASAELRKRSLGPEHPLVAASLDNLASALASMGRFEDAEATAREAFAIAEKSLGPDNPEMVLFNANLGSILRERGRPGDALPHLRRALQIQERAFAPDHPFTAQVLTALAMVLIDLELHDEAIVHLQRSWDIAQHAEVAPSVVATAGLRLATTLWRRSIDRSRAIEIAEQARDRLAKAGADASDEQLKSLDEWLADHSVNPEP